MYRVELSFEAEYGSLKWTFSLDKVTRCDWYTGSVTSSWSISLTLKEEKTTTEMIEESLCKLGPFQKEYIDSNEAPEEDRQD